MKVIIELPGIKAVSRNQTTGHYFNYKSVLNEAEKWAWVHAKSKEYHFQKLVDVHIDAYIDTVHPYKVITKSGKVRMEYANIIDTPNIDDKIFTDILNRWKAQKDPVTKKIVRAERNPWFIEDDNPKYLRYVTKHAVPADQWKVVITITEVEE